MSCLKSKTTCAPFSLKLCVCSLGSSTINLLLVFSTGLIALRASVINPLVAPGYSTGSPVAGSVNGTFGASAGKLVSSMRPAVGVSNTTPSPCLIPLKSTFGFKKLGNNPP